MFLAKSYYTLLLLIIIFYIFLLYVNQKYTPKGMKLYINIFLILGIVKNIYILFLSFIQGKNINLDKLLVYLDIIYIPFLILTIFYIFWRKDRIKYIKVLSVGSIFIMFYVIINLFLVSKYKLFYSLGNTVIFENDVIFRFINVILLVILFTISIFIKQNKSTIHTGMNLLMFGMLALILDNIAIVILNGYFPYCLLSEGVILLIFDFSLKTFKS